MNAPPRRVSVIGLGLLGSAIARAFFDSGYELTVWNRSPERAVAFDGTAQVASSVAEACNASDVIVVCLIAPDACRSALRQPPSEQAISGKLVVQLTTTTPDDALDEARWASRHGAEYLGGAILASPATVGTDRAKAFYSGPQDVFDEHRLLLQVLAPNSVYLGEPVGRAATMDHALLELSYGCLAVLYHSVALCEAGSVPPKTSSTRSPSSPKDSSNSRPQRSGQAAIRLEARRCTRLSRGPSNWSEQPRRRA